MLQINGLRMVPRKGGKTVRKGIDMGATLAMVGGLMSTITYSVLLPDGTLEQRKSIPVIYMGVSYVPAECIGVAEGGIYWLTGQPVTLTSPYDTRQGHPAHRTGYGILPIGTRIKLRRMGDERSHAVWEVEAPLSNHQTTGEQTK